MSPEELVRCIDFRYITDCITPEEALTLLQQRAHNKALRLEKLQDEGYPCYTTSAGWLGYPDDKLRRLCQDAVDAGFDYLKLKVGRDLEDDIRRVRITREVLGPDRKLMIDANQIWETNEAIPWVNQLAFANPWFIEEPTNPDDIEGHRRIRQGVCSGQSGNGRNVPEPHYVQTIHHARSH